jgi:putative hydrolase
MIDLHTHTVLSDGAVLPAELVRHAQIAGYQAIALTDHVDSGSLEIILKQLIRLAEKLDSLGQIRVLAGVEITHMPPALIPEMAREARKMGARIVVVHGESPVEPVCPGTNLAALESDVDILAHPGMITEQEVALAQQKGICLELSARKGHSLTNGRLAALARKHNAKLVVNTDAHKPGELFSPELLRKVGLGAGLTESEFERALINSADLVAKRG